MKIVLTGATGNVGSAVAQELVLDGHEVVGIARRPAERPPAGIDLRLADLAADNLLPLVRGADAVVHLAWLFQPVRRPQVTWTANVTGTERLLSAVDEADVPAVVVASSVGAYAPRAGLDRVDETWPTDGVPQTAYSREKAYVERLLDVHEARHPDRRVVRMRPAFIFQRASAVQQRRLFLGPFAPHSLLQPGRLPVLPMPRDLRLQTLHTADAAAAYAAAVSRPVRGAFNLAAEPVLDPDALASLLRSRWVPVPAGTARAGLAAAHRVRAVPASPELFDLAMSVPLMATDRAREELGWSPRASAGEALAAFFAGLAAEPSPGTAPLDPSTSGPARVHELATGMGSTDD